MKTRSTRVEQRTEPILIKPGVTKQFLLQEGWVLIGLISGTFQLTSGREKTLEMLEKMFPSLKLRS